MNVFNGPAVVAVDQSPRSTTAGLEKEKEEKIKDNGHSDRNGICSLNGEPQPEESDSELTELERQIVAKYLSELEGDSSSDCDLNNNCNEMLVIGKPHPDGIGYQEKGVEDGKRTEEDKEITHDNSFPAPVSKDELAAMGILLRQFPQLSRRTSLDSVEDLVSACPQLVHLLKQVAVNTATATSAQPSESHVQQNCSSSVASQFNETPSSNYISPSSISAADVARPALTNAAAGWASGCNCAATNRGVPKNCDCTAEELSGAGRLQKKKATADKAIKKRPNYSVWMGVTSCIWGLLFYLIKNYM